MPRHRGRTLEIGGLGKPELLSALTEHGIRLNEYAHVLFEDPAFTTSGRGRLVHVTEVTIANLGLTEGGTSADIFARAEGADLELCPLELAPRLRLQFLDQTDGPYLTIASRKTRDDDSYPNGFYLRRFDGELWLRGYQATSSHRWEPTSRFVFLTN